MILSSFPNAMPLEGLIGGLLIGLAAAVLLLGSGRIAGISGITAKALTVSKEGMPAIAAWMFIAGLLLGTMIVQSMFGPIEASFTPSVGLLIAAGLLVGFGTRMGSGCTSGHGVCGMSRLSPRSLIATGSFIASSILTVAIANQLGWRW